MRGHIVTELSSAMAELDDNETAGMAVATQAMAGKIF
jgi:hypothetical protein